MIKNNYTAFTILRLIKHKLRNKENIKKNKNKHKLGIWELREDRDLCIKILKVKSPKQLSFVHIA